MHKQELVTLLSHRKGLTRRDAELAVQGFIEEVQDAMARHETVTLIGLGTFRVDAKSARTAINPRTREKINVKAGYKVNFRPSKVVKEKASAWPADSALLPADLPTKQPATKKMTAAPTKKAGRK